MRRPKVNLPNTRDRSLVGVDPECVVAAFRDGLRIDNASTAAGDAFLAVSYFHRKDETRSRAHAIAACKANPAAWSDLRACLGAP